MTSKKFEANKKNPRTEPSSDWGCKIDTKWKGLRNGLVLVAKILRLILELAKAWNQN